MSRAQTPWRGGVRSRPHKTRANVERTLVGWPQVVRTRFVKTAMKNTQLNSAYVRTFSARVLAQRCDLSRILGGVAKIMSRVHTKI